MNGAVTQLPSSARHPTGGLMMGGSEVWRLPGSFRCAPSPPSAKLAGERLSQPPRSVVRMPSRPPRRSSLRVRLELGLAAFAPALILLAVRSRDSGWAWLFIVPAGVGILVLVVGILIVRRGSPDPFGFGDIADLSGEVLGHIGAYLLPVLIVSSRSTEEIVISAIVVALIIHIHVATGRVFVNPLLYLLGYRIYSAESGGKTFYLIARSDVSAWASPRRCVRIGSSVLVERHK